MITETELFHQIFEDFVSLEDNVNDNEIWKSKSIIKLMKMSNEVPNTQILEEGLKAILSLCKFRENGYLIDSYESESFSVDNLTEPEEMLLNSILRAEFT
ncbi:MAG: hypothetical protein ACFFFB_12320 [Candidatus Heimdallarchaeota archaeon]